MLSFELIRHSKKNRPEPVLFLVAPTGVEPVISGMKTQRPRPLDDGAERGKRESNAFPLTERGAHIAKQYGAEMIAALKQ